MSEGDTHIISLAHASGSRKICSVYIDTHYIEQTLLREVVEETGWRVAPVGIIGFTHAHHLDEQRPNWGRPAPDFVDPLFAVVAKEFDASLMDINTPKCEFVAVEDVERLGVEEINRRFLDAALQKCSVG